MYTDYLSHFFEVVADVTLPVSAVVHSALSFFLHDWYAIKFLKYVRLAWCANSATSRALINAKAELCGCDMSKEQWWHSHDVALCGRCQNIYFAHHTLQCSLILNVGLSCLLSRSGRTTIRTSRRRVWFLFLEWDAGTHGKAMEACIIYSYDCMTSRLYASLGNSALLTENIVNEMKSCQHDLENMKPNIYRVSSKTPYD